MGYGKAEKRQVMDMTRRLLKLNCIPGRTMRRMPWLWRSATPAAPRRCCARIRWPSPQYRRKQIVLLSRRHGCLSRAESCGDRLRWRGLCLRYHEPHAHACSRGRGRSCSPSQRERGWSGLVRLYSQNELSAFRQLIGVSGVGPKAALAILSSSTPDQLALAIVTGDEKSAGSRAGIGKKLPSVSS